MTFKIGYAYLVMPITYLLLNLWIWYLAASGELPEPMAIHWGFSLSPDGFTSVIGYQIVVAITLGSVIALYFISLASLKRKPILRKFLGNVLSAVYLMIFSIMFVGTFIQISVGDSREANFPAGVFLLLLLLVSAAIWIFLAFPEIELSDKIRIKLRGFSFLALDFEDVESVGFEVIRPVSFGGWGLRVRGSRIAFIPSKGEAVILKLKSGEEVAIRVKNGTSSLEAIQARIR